MRTEQQDDYSLDTLEEKNLPVEPQVLFSSWYSDAKSANVYEPYALTLSTFSKSLGLTSRVVFMRNFHENVITFFTNYLSTKGKSIAENPEVCGTFYWEKLQRQIHFSGKAVKTNAKISDQYFSTRPLESRIGAWASTQSQTLDKREDLEKRVEKYKKKWGTNPPRPEYWGGYSIHLNGYEFWQGKPFRLHDRVAYELTNHHTWKRKRLFP